MGLNTLCLMALQAGNYCRDDMVSSLVQLVQETRELHAYASRCLLRAVQANRSQQPLCQVAAWCVGEYGDLVVAPPSPGADGADDDADVQVGGRGQTALCLAVGIGRVFPKIRSKCE